MRQFLLCATVLGLSAALFAGDVRAEDGAPAGVSAARPGLAYMGRKGASAEILKHRGAAPRRAAPGERIMVGNEVRSLEEPVRLELAGGATLELAPRSRVALGGRPKLVLGSAGRLTVPHFDLREGEVLVEVPAGRGEAGAVVGSGQSMVAVRTKSTARLSVRDGVLALALYAGEAHAATRWTWQRIPERHFAELRSGDALEAPRPLDRGPSWRTDGAGEEEGPLGLVFSEGDKARMSLRFTPAAEATGYTAEIAHDEAFLRPLARLELSAAETRVVTPELPPGRYFARVRVRGPGGLPGLPGPARSLRVVRLDLPPSGRTEGRTLMIPLDRQIALDDASGLELTFGKGFVKAPGTFGLPKAERTIAAIRLAGEPTWQSFWLAPSPVRAEIDLGPKKAIWPLDPVEIKVRVLDGSRPARGVQPKLKVTINLEEIPVTWTREGDTLRARIEPRRPPGPWVVRVEATDEHGSELGRGFLEVIAPERPRPPRRVRAK